MPLQKTRPTSPGRRHVVKVTTPDLYKGAPHGPLLESKHSTGGRNNHGHMTTRHKGGGHKQTYRIIDFKRDKDSVPAEVEHIEYDPNRTTHIALLKYKDGERRYIIAPRGVKPGDAIQSGFDAPIKPGNALPLRNIPIGSTVHCVELRHGKGAQLARSAGAGTSSRYATTRTIEQLLAKPSVRLNAGNMRALAMASARVSPSGSQATLGNQTMASGACAGLTPNRRATRAATAATSTTLRYCMKATSRASAP